MSRQRTIPDSVVLQAVRDLLAQGGTKAASFRAVARATGLAAATLVQRHGTQAAMVAAAQLALWDAADAALAEAEAAAAMNPKGAAALLKALPPVPVPDAANRERASQWRAGVEAALAARMGSKEAAATLFAAWFGRMIWGGDKAFSLRDLARRLG
jgi:hypothetical protein